MLGTCLDLYPRVYVSFTWAGVTPRAQGCLRIPVASLLQPGTLAPLATWHLVEDPLVLR